MDFSNFLIDYDLMYRITWDKRLLVNNIFWFNICLDIEGLKRFIREFLTTLENDNLKLKTQFPRGIYVKIAILVTVECPLAGKQSREYYFSTVSYKVNSKEDFKDKMNYIIIDILEQIEKLRDSIVLESNCEIVDIILLHINVSEWVNRYQVSERFKISPKEIEIFETKNVIGFRHIKTKRFIYVIRKQKKVTYIRIGKREKIKRKKKVSRGKKRVTRKTKKVSDKKKADSKKKTKKR